MSSNHARNRSMPGKVPPQRPRRGRGTNFPGLIDWWGPLFTPTGFGDEARGFVKGLRTLGFPLKVVPIHTQLPFAELIGKDDPPFFLDVVESMKLTEKHPHVAVVHAGATAKFEPVGGADYTIVRTMWETDRLYPGCAASLNTVNEVWVPSQFNAELFRASGVRVPIEVIGGGVDIRTFRPGLEPMAIAGANGTVFLSIFEWSFRKGWDVLLRAWASAFRPEDDVTLVLRIYPRNNFSNEVGLQAQSEALLTAGLAELGLRRQDLAPIIVVGSHLGAADMPRLMAAADCYVGPSRGEGWGRPFQEAMASGLPVIGTRWSGNLEFMNDENSLLVDVERLAPVDDRMDIAHYHGQRWAEPSSEHLATLLGRVAGDAVLRRELGRRARADIERTWQWSHIASLAADRLLELGAELDARSTSGPVPPVLDAGLEIPPPPPGTPTGARPLVSVLMPVYNRATMLRESLQSVLEQSYGDLEILVVDNASTDDSRAVAEEFARHDARVRVVSNETNLGMLGNHRRALELATGEYVKFVHADDRLRPTAIDRLVAAIRSGAGIRLATASREIIDESGELQPAIRSTKPIATVDSLFNGVEVGTAMLKNGLNLVGEPTSVLFVRKGLEAAHFATLNGHGYNSLLDVSTWLALLHTGQLAFIAEPLSYVRMHAGQEGRALGAVTEHIEWLHALRDGWELGFLRGPNEFLEAVQTISGRLVGAALEVVGPQRQLALEALAGLLETSAPTEIDVRAELVGVA